MPVFMLRAVRTSADGCKSAHVASMWPYRAADLSSAKRFVDETPDVGWSDADTYEIADETGCRLCCRPIAAETDDASALWMDAEDEGTD